MKTFIKSGVFIGGSILITLIIWLGSKNYYGESFVYFEKYIAKSASLSGMVLMMWSFLLSVKSKFLDRVFGGLDKVYKIHGFVGFLVYLMFVIHGVVILVLNNKYNLYENSTQLLGFNLGIISLIAMSLLVFATGWKKLPYDLWKKTHGFFGWLYFVFLWHVFLIDGDIVKYPLLKIWMMGVFAVSIFAFLYGKYLFRFFGKVLNYKITSLKHINDVVKIEISPENESILYEAGQFVYVDFFAKGDFHPFSILSAPNKDGKIKLGIKQVGNYTNLIDKLMVYSSIRVYGPFGHLGDKVFYTNKDCVFIAGGIGVTPLIGIWEELASQDFGNRKMTLIYSTKEEKECVFNNDILNIDNKNENYKYKKHNSNNEGFLDYNYMKKNVKNLDNSLIFICGPKIMINNLIKDFKKNGIKNSQIIVEDFGWKNN